MTKALFPIISYDTHPILIKWMFREDFKLKNLIDSDNEILVLSNYVLPFHLGYVNLYSIITTELDYKITSHLKFNLPVLIIYNEFSRSEIWTSIRTPKTDRFLSSIFFNWKGYLSAVNENLEVKCTIGLTTMDRKASKDVYPDVSMHCIYMYNFVYSSIIMHTHLYNVYGSGERFRFSFLSSGSIYLLHE